MSLMKLLCVFAVVAVVILLHQTDARPYRTLSRQKRISDQRLAELETLIALSKMKSKMVTIPVGFGKVDPLKIGRRKRSAEELLKDLLKDVTSDEIRGEKMADDESDRSEDYNESLLSYDERRRTIGHRHLPVRLPE